MTHELFSKCSLGGIEVRNRFVRSATWENMADNDGFATEQLTDTFVDMAKGGVGLIITGFARVLSDDLIAPRMIGVYDDKFIDSYKAMTDQVHKFGGKIAIQLASGSSQTKYRARRRRVVGPSEVADKMYGTIPEQMSIEDIKLHINGYAAAAKRAKLSGYDAVQLHCAHGYMLSKFLNPYYNRRTDQYGGDTHSRARIIYEIIEAIQDLVGDYPILIKINCEDFNGDDVGLSLDESIEVCKRLDKMGVAAIEVSGATAGSPVELRPIRAVRKDTQSYFYEQGKLIAEQVRCDVALVGGHRSLEKIEQMYDNSRIGFFSLSRPLICEPDLVNKWSEQPDYKPLCVSCGKCWHPSGTKCLLFR